MVAEFLVKFLEQEVCRLHWDVGFVTVTMQEIGVQLPRLLEVYDQLFKTRVCTHTHTHRHLSSCSLHQFSQFGPDSGSSSHLKDPCWQRLRKPLHLVECIHVLLQGYVDDPSRVPTYDR